MFVLQLMERTKGLYKLDTEQTDQSVLTRCPGEAKAPHHGSVLTQWIGVLLPQGCPGLVLQET